MFCPKCGTKTVDGAKYCQTCGMNLAEDISAPPPSPEPVSPPAAAPTPEPAPAPASAPKKKSKLPIILGVTILVLVVVAAAAFAVFKLSQGGKPVYDFKETVREYEPYAKSQKMPYTCGEVFDQYIEKAEWDIEESDDGAGVEISGTMEGTDQEIVVAMRVEIEDDEATFESITVKIDGKKPKEDAFFALFQAYDLGEKDLTRFEVLLNGGNLFLLGDWEGEADLTDALTQVMADSIGDNEAMEYISFEKFLMTLRLSLDQDGNYIMSVDEAKLEETVNDLLIDLKDSMRGYFADMIWSEGFEMSVDEFFEYMVGVSYDDYMDSIMSADMVMAEFGSLEDRGTYKVKDDELILSGEYGGEETYTFVVDKNTLTLDSDEDFKFGADIFPLKLKKQ